MRKNMEESLLFQKNLHLPVLVIGANPQELGTLTSTIHKTGYQAAACKNMQEARREIESQSFPLIFCDIFFEGMAGFELQELVAERYPATQFVMMADFDQVKTARAANRLGATDLLFKPVKQDELESHIKRGMALHYSRKRDELYMRELQDNIQQRTREIESISNVSLALNQIRDLDALLNLILEEIVSLTTADAGTIYLIEGPKNSFPNPELDKDFSPWTLRFKSALNRSRELDLKEYSLPISEKSMAGYCAMQGRIINVQDTYSLPKVLPFHFNRSFDEKMEYQTRSVLAIPLKNHIDEIIGVVQVINRKHRQEDRLTQAKSFDLLVTSFDKEQEKIVRLFSAHAGIALYNTKILNDLHVTTTRLSKSADEIHDTQEVTFIALAKLAESRDPETGQHLERIRYYTKILAETLGRNKAFSGVIDDWFISTIFKSSPLHDIGKVGIPDHVLLKPGKLTEAEFEQMKKHTIIGGDAILKSEKKLKGESFLKMGKEIAYYHHEKWDGTGYPFNLAGEKIPLSARIMALADIFDALTSRRVYKKAFDQDLARDIILKEEGKHLDPDVVRAFRDCWKGFMQ
ncbi:MAG: response regulator, partial [Nitrospinae bacterium]|nr:response regulator [Nitrospinota bacterium]